MSPGIFSDENLLCPSLIETREDISSIAQPVVCVAVAIICLSYVKEVTRKGHVQLK